MSDDCRDPHGHPLLVLRNLVIRCHPSDAPAVEHTTDGIVFCGVLEFVFEHAEGIVVGNLFEADPNVPPGRIVISGSPAE